MSDADAWNANHGLSFGEAKPADEYFHGWGPKGDSLTETWYWGFNVPEAQINCFAYCWTHPNLGVATPGLIIYKGVKRQHLECELFDFTGYARLDRVVGDGRLIAAPNGMRVEVLEPLRRMRLSYSDSYRQTSCDVELRAVGRPIMRANNLHFEQVMHCKGQLKLRGENYDVDSFTVRDRSWGELRPEDHVPSPPYNWVTGVFDGGRYAFNIGSLDDPAGNPEWLGKMQVDPSKIFKDGWVARGDDQSRVVNAFKRVYRNRVSLAPERFEIDLEEESGGQTHITGDVIASTPGFHWPNICTHLALVRWCKDGVIGYGESQDVQWNDSVYKCSLP